MVRFSQSSFEIYLCTFCMLKLVSRINFPIYILNPYNSSFYRFKEK